MKRIKKFLIDADLMLTAGILATLCADSDKAAWGIVAVLLAALVKQLIHLSKFLEKTFEDYEYKGD